MPFSSVSVTDSSLFVLWLLISFVIVGFSSARERCRHIRRIFFSIHRSHRIDRQKKNRRAPPGLGFTEFYCVSSDPRTLPPPNEIQVFFWQRRSMQRPRHVPSGGQKKNPRKKERGVDRPEKRGGTSPRNKTKSTKGQKKKVNIETTLPAQTKPVRRQQTKHTHTHTFKKKIAMTFLYIMDSLEKVVIIIYAASSLSTLVASFLLLFCSTTGNHGNRTGEQVSLAGFSSSSSSSSSSSFLFHFFFF